jgi:uncharacterized membrane protein YozB (DUF420 family)
MERANFKSMSRVLVMGLVVVIALVAYDITIPKGRSSSKNWRFVLTHPTILLHIVFAVVVVIAAIALLVRSVRSHNRTWILISMLGVAFVLLAFAMGEIYVTNLNNSALSNMGLAWFGAIATYGVGWYLSRAKVNQAA